MLDYRVRAQLGVLPKKLVERVDSAVRNSTDALSDRVQRKISGDVVNRRSGSLVAAIQHGTYIQRTDSGIRGFVGMEGASKEVSIYASSVEFGSNHPARIVQALHASALRFQVGGRFVFAKSVNIPAFKMPAHSFLRSSFNEMRGAIQRSIFEAARVEEVL